MQMKSFWRLKYKYVGHILCYPYLSSSQTRHLVYLTWRLNLASNRFYDCPPHIRKDVCSTPDCDRHKSFQLHCLSLSKRCEYHINESSSFPVKLVKTNWREVMYISHNVHKLSTSRHLELAARNSQIEILSS